MIWRNDDAAPLASQLPSSIVRLKRDGNIMEIFLLAGDKREYVCVNSIKRVQYIGGGVLQKHSIRVWV